MTPQSNLKTLGQALYNYYLPLVLLVTLILLMAMVAVITLTLDSSSPGKTLSPTHRRSLGNVY